MDRLDGFLVAGVSCAPDWHPASGDWLLPLAACWYGRRDDTARQAIGQGLNWQPCRATVTLLGATGSIGSSTIDLLRRDPGRYQVEAITAHRNGAALARLARELGARFAAVARAGCLSGTEGRTVRHADRSGRRSGRPGRSRASGPPIGSWLRSPARPASSRRSLPPSAAPQWRSPTRSAWSAPAPCSCAAPPPPAPRFCRSIPSTTRSFRRSSAGRREDVRRIILTASGGPFRTWPLEADPQGHAGAGAQTSDLVDGAEDHDRFRDADEQGARTDRGAASVRAGAGGARCRRASAIGRPRPGRISRRLGDRAARLAGYAHPDRALPGLSRAHGHARRNGSISLASRR